MINPWMTQRLQIGEREKKQTSDEQPSRTCKNGGRRNNVCQKKHEKEAKKKYVGGWRNSERVGRAD